MEQNPKIIVCRMENGHWTAYINKRDENPVYEISLNSAAEALGKLLLKNLSIVKYYVEVR